MIDLTEVLRLEVDVPGELDNLIRNPNGEKGAWFWKVAFSGHAISSNGVRLRLQNGNSAAASSVANSGMMQIPDGGGKYVAFRMTSISMTAACQYRVTIFAYNAAQTVLGSTVGAWNINAGVGTVSDYTVPAWQLPAGTEYVHVQLMLDANPTTNNLPANAFVEFNQVKLAWSNSSGGFLSPYATNFFVNPSFEGATDEWTFDAQWGGGPKGITNQGTPRTGTKLYFVTKPAGTPVSIIRSNAFPVTPGKAYEASVYFRSSSGPNVGIVTYVEYYDDTNALISSTNSGAQVVSTTTYQRSKVSATAPSNADTAKMVISCASTYGQPATVWLDDVMFCDRVNESWFYGSTAAAGQFQYGWTGTANNSTSTKGFTAFGYTEPGNWFDLFTDGSQLTVDRASLDNGRLNAVVETEAFTQADILRAGRRIRWQTLDRGDWKSLYEGTISDWKTTHRREASRTQIIASDELAQIQAYPWEGGIQFIEHIAYYLETYFNGLLPWLINGDYGQYSSTPTAVSQGVASNMLDHFRLCRDVERAYMYISRDGVFVANNQGRNQGEFKFTDDSIEVWKTKLSIPDHGNGTAYTTSYLLWGVGNTRLTAKTTYSLTGGAYRATVFGGDYGEPLGFYLRGQPLNPSGIGAHVMTTDYTEQYRFTGRWRASQSSGPVNVRVAYYANAANSFAFLGYQTVEVLPSTTVNTWAPFEAIFDTADAPAGATYLAFEIIETPLSGDMWTTNDWVEIDDVQIDRNAGLKYYYDYDLEVADDSQTVGNVIDVTFCDHNFTTNVTTKVAMGPYRDYASISRYGQRKQEWVIQGINSSSVAAWAATTLGLTKDAEEVPSSLTIYITEPEETQLALLDLEQLAEFVFRGTNYGYYAVSNIKHEVLTGNRWKITYDFVKSAALAKPVKPNQR